MSNRNHRAAKRRVYLESGPTPSQARALSWLSDGRYHDFYNRPFDVSHHALAKCAHRGWATRNTFKEQYEITDAGRVALSSLRGKGAAQ